MDKETKAKKKALASESSQGKLTFHFKDIITSFAKAYRSKSDQEARNEIITDGIKTKTEHTVYKAEEGKWRNTKLNLFLRERLSTYDVTLIVCVDVSDLDRSLEQMDFAKNIYKLISIPTKNKLKQQNPSYNDQKQFKQQHQNYQDKPIDEGKKRSYSENHDQKTTDCVRGKASSLRGLFSHKPTVKNNKIDSIKDDLEVEMFDLSPITLQSKCEDEITSGEKIGKFDQLSDASLKKKCEDQKHRQEKIVKEMVRKRLEKIHEKEVELLWQEVMQNDQMHSLNKDNQETSDKDVVFSLNSSFGNALNRNIKLVDPDDEEEDEQAKVSRSLDKSQTWKENEFDQETNKRICTRFKIF